MRPGARNRTVFTVVTGAWAGGGHGAAGGGARGAGMDGRAGARWATGGRGGAALWARTTITITITTTVMVW